MTAALALVPPPSQTEQSLFDLLRGSNVDREIAAIQADHFLKTQVRDSREAWVIQAQVVFIVRAKKLWQHHPAGFRNFTEWTRQPEIDLSPSVVSDMLGLCQYDELLREAGIDIWAYVRENGQSKVRQLVPRIRQAAKQSCTVDDIRDPSVAHLPIGALYDVAQVESIIRPLISALPDASYREVVAMVSCQDRDLKLSFDPVIRYIPHDEDDTASLLFERLDSDQIEYLNTKLKLRRWANARGHRIPCPLDFRGAGFDDGEDD